MEEKYEERYLRAGSSRYYVKGSAVPAEDFPERRRRRKRVSSQVRRNREKAVPMSAPYVCLLAAAVVLTLFICARYLGLQSDIVSCRHSIKTLQTSIEELRTQNDATEDSLAIYTDLDYIYEVATGELGMVYPSEDQIIEYDREESEYVRQYEDIPTDG